MFHTTSLDNKIGMVSVNGVGFWVSVHKLILTCILRKVSTYKLKIPDLVN